MNPNLDLSIVVCTHNRYQVLDKALKSIETQDIPASSFELIVVDNSTEKDIQAHFHSRNDLLCSNRIIFEAVPGLSRARNIGVRAAQAPIVAFMDDDAVASPSWAAEIVGAFKRYPNAAIAGGPVRPLWPVSRPKWLHPGLEGFLTIVDRGAEERTLDGHEWLAGTNIAFLRDPLIASGLFNEQLGRIGRILLSNEELAVTRKIRDLGYTAVYNPKADVHHNVHQDRISQSWFRRRVFWQMISDIFDHDDETQFSQRLETLLTFQDKLDPRDRGLVGMFKELDEPEVFHAQTMAIAALIGLLATDGRDLREFLSAKNP